MTPADEQQILSRSADELRTTAEQLARVAKELTSVAKGIETEWDPERLRLQAIGAQTESMRAALAAFAARAVSERLAVLAIHYESEAREGAEMAARVLAAQRSELSPPPPVEPGDAND